LILSSSFIFLEPFPPKIYAFYIYKAHPPVLTLTQDSREYPQIPSAYPKPTLKGGFMNEPIGDEAVYLRIAQFEKELIQLTDTTNAYRLFAKYGPDIRYNAPWKNGWSGTALTGNWTTGALSMTGASA
jgi:hypothetical protein